MNQSEALLLKGIAVKEYKYLVKTRIKDNHPILHGHHSPVDNDSRQSRLFSQNAISIAYHSVTVAPDYCETPDWKSQAEYRTAEVSLAEQ